MLRLYKYKDESGLQKCDGRGIEEGMWAATNYYALLGIWPAAGRDSNWDFAQHFVLVYLQIWSRVRGCCSTQAGTFIATIIAMR